MAVTEQTSRTAEGSPNALASRPAGRLPLPVRLYLATVLLTVSFHLGPLYMTGMRVLLIFLVVPLAVNLLRGKYGRLFPTDILFLLHLCWTAIAMAVNNPDRVVQNIGAQGIEFLGGYLLARAYIRSAADFIALSRALVVLTGLTLPFAIIEAVTGRQLLIEALRALPGLGTVLPANAGIRLGLHRVQMDFAHPIHYGLFCSIAFSLCFVGLKGIYGDAKRYVLSGVDAFCGALALSSGALLAILLQIFLIGWHWLFERNRNRWFLLVGLMLAGYVTVDVLSNRTPVQVFLSYATFSAHTAYYRKLIFDWGMVNVWAHPIFGIGLNDWLRPHWMVSNSVDNFWLVIAMRFGIPAFLLLAAGYLIPLWQIARRPFDGDGQLLRLRRAWVFTFVGLTFTLTTVDIWTTIYSFVFFMFGAGMWFLNAEPGQDGEAVEAATESPPARDRPSLARLLPALLYRRPPPPPRKRPAAPATTRTQAPPQLRRPPGRPAYSRFPARPQPGRSDGPDDDR